jgi:hypothetical protein
MPVWSLSRDGAEAQLRIANIVQYLASIQAK